MLHPLPVGTVIPVHGPRGAQQAVIAVTLLAMPAVVRVFDGADAAEIVVMVANAGAGPRDPRDFTVDAPVEGDCRRADSSA
jgi:hypothetical protein